MDTINIKLLASTLPEHDLDLANFFSYEHGSRGFDCLRSVEIWFQMCQFHAMKTRYQLPLKDSVASYELTLIVAGLQKKVLLVQGV